ncbi:MAG TPA: Hpt domain-containing protein, partial [Caulobacteraceae bacterium]|nr:Hpt domain-containing protein [Caulobacteraceae bacterium]
MDELEQIKATFFQECDELLADLESGLLAMEAGTGDAETVNAVFRAVHSVKGGAGAFGLEALVRYAHVFETLLDDVRSGKIEAAAELVRTLLRAADVLSDQVSAARTDGAPDEAATAAMVAELEAWIAGHGPAAAMAAAAAPPAAPAAPASDSDMDLGFEFKPMTVAVDDITPAAPPAPVSGAPGDDIGISFTPMTVAIEEFGAPEEPVAPAEQTWIISFRPLATLYAKANESVLLMRELERLGPIEPVLDDSDLPSLTAMDAEGSYLAWTVRLTTDATEEI